MTYRLSSHVGPENDSYIYRTEKEVEDWEKRCPIKNFEDLIKGKLYSNKKELMRKISEEIKNSFINAKKSDYLKTINWETFNISNKLPLEIREIEIESSTFHHSDTLPEPY
jgi:TPP-dependent pyruvate/acetoin dehydrogenase alpha subunit